MHLAPLLFTATTPATHAAMAIWVVAAILAPPVNAQDLAAPMPPSYRFECGSCHVPYPAALMTQRGWSDLLQSLDNHFGENAVPEIPARREIEQYLTQHANVKEHSFGSRTEPARISTTHWFRLTHGVAKKLFKDIRVGTVANCSACHRQAEGGQFSAENVTLPNRL